MFPLLNKTILQASQASETILTAHGGHLNHSFHSLKSYHLAEICSLNQGTHLGREVIPSARMEALMQHFQAAGFSEEISSLAAAPIRTSSNHMYDDRWLCCAHWAEGQGIDPLGPTAAQIVTFL